MRHLPPSRVAFPWARSHTSLEYGTVGAMSGTQKITVEVPVELLAKAREASGGNVTEAVRRGLRLVAASGALRSLRARRGRVRRWPRNEALRADRG